MGLIKDLQTGRRIRRELEQRDAKIAASLRYAAKELQFDKNTIALLAIQACANIWGFSLASSKVTADNDLIEAAISPDFLECVGRDLLIQGESLWLIRLAGRNLIRINNYNMVGDYDPKTWKYDQVGVPAPTGARTLKVAQNPSKILHFKIGATKDEPWKGVSPIMSCKDLDIINALRASLIHDLKQKPSRKWVNPTFSSKDKLLEDQDKDKKKEDAVLSIEDFVPPEEVNVPDMKVLSSGPEFTQQTVNLFSEMKQEIAHACGIPPGFAAGGSSGAAAREEIRRLMTLTIEPVGIKIQDELRKKIDSSITVDPGVLTRKGDIASRARGVQSLTGAGFSRQRAAEEGGFGDPGTAET